MKQFFHSEVSQVASFEPTAAIADLAQEVGMYSCSPDFVMKHGGDLTKSIVEKIPQSWYEKCDALELYPNIDVRVHRLYPNDYPANPGWHCDGEFRKDYYSQPELDKVPHHRHLVGTISSEAGGVSLTEFITEDVELDIDPDHVWSSAHQQIAAHGLATMTAQDGRLYDFGSFTLHRCTPARVRGWRLFVRASMWHKPYLEGEGTVARQEYVYRLREDTGW